jgi:hypothetical protein
MWPFSETVCTTNRCIGTYLICAGRNLGGEEVEVENYLAFNQNSCCIWCEYLVKGKRTGSSEKSLVLTLTLTLNQNAQKNM